MPWADHREARLSSHQTGRREESRSREDRRDCRRTLETEEACPDSRWWEGDCSVGRSSGRLPLAVRSRDWPARTETVNSGSNASLEEHGPSVFRPGALWHWSRVEPRTKNAVLHSLLTFWELWQPITHEPLLITPAAENCLFVSHPLTPTSRPLSILWNADTVHEFLQELGNFRRPMAQHASGRHRTFNGQMHLIGYRVSGYFGLEPELNDPKPRALSPKELQS